MLRLAPDSPMVALFSVPQANISSTTPVADAQVIDPPVPTPGERKLQLHLQMTRLQSKLDNL